MLTWLRHAEYFLCWFFVALAVSIVNVSVLADSCYEDAFIDAQDDPEQSLMRLVDVAFEGKAVAKWTETEELLGLEPRVRKVTVSFLVDTVHKGEVPLDKAVKVSGGAEICSCIKDFELGKSYRVLAFAAEDDSSTELQLRYCSFNYEVER